MPQCSVWRNVATRGIPHSNNIFLCRILIIMKNCAINNSYKILLNFHYYYLFSTSIFYVKKYTVCLAKKFIRYR